jgi:hypothetical protein
VRPIKIPVEFFEEGVRHLQEAFGDSWHKQVVNQIIVPEQYRNIAAAI